VVAETHLISRDRRTRALAKAARRLQNLRAIVTIAPTIAAHLTELGAPATKVLTLPSGVDLALFARPGGRPLRRSPSPQVVYSGHLYDYKGIPTILQAAALLPEIRFTLVGGLPKDLERARETVRKRSLSNVQLIGMKPYAEVPAILWDADVLLLPPSSRHRSAAFTSPVKLGEYLASGSPVVATRIPALEHIVTDREVCFVPPDDAPALAAGIRRVLSDSPYAERLSTAAMALAAELSYAGRAQTILDHALRV